MLIVIKRCVWLLLCLTVCWPCAAYGENGFTVQMNFENDVQFDTDCDYSNGVQLRFISEALNEFSIGQNIYTPKNKKAKELQEDDRPYAGYLYGALDLRRINPSSLDTLEFSLGVVGPAAFGEQAQNGFHKVINANRADGWDNQLENEPLFMLTLARVWSLNPQASVNGGMGWDLLPRVSASLGTPYTQATVSVEAHVGWNLPADFCSTVIRPGPGVLVSDAEGFDVYFLLALEGRAVAWNTFLDGNAWRDSHSVDKYPFVGEFRAGIAASYKKLRLSYVYIHNTKEFHGQEDEHDYGSITASWVF